MADYDKLTQAKALFGVLAGNHRRQRLFWKHNALVSGLYPIWSDDLSYGTPQIRTIAIDDHSIYVATPESATAGQWLGDVHVSNKSEAEFDDSYSANSALLAVDIWNNRIKLEPVADNYLPSVTIGGVNIYDNAVRITTDLDNSVGIPQITSITITTVV